MSKKSIFQIISIFMVIVLCTTCLPLCVWADTFDDKCFRFYPTENVPGSNYNHISEVGYFIELENKNEDNLSISIDYQVTDEKGDLIWHNQENIEISPRMTFAKTYKISGENRNGFFLMKATAKGTFGEITREHKFSISPKNQVLNENIGLPAHFNFGSYSYDELGDKVKNSGAKWIRDAFLWDELEKEATENDAERFKVNPVHEENINRMLANGHKVLIILGYTNPLYDDGNFPTSDEAVAAFARYCGFVADYFKGRVEHFEIFNEPDIKKLDDNTFVSGTQYAKLSDAAAEAVKKANPDAYVMTGSMSSAYTKGPLEFTDEFLANADMTNIDAISFHPYSHENNDIYSDEKDYFSKHPYTFLERVDLLKDVMTKYGIGNIPIWITEYGVSSTTQNGMECDEIKQAANIVRTSIYARQDSQIEKNFIFTIIDKGVNKDDYEENWGLMRNNRTVKPSYIAFSAMNYIIGNSNYELSYNQPPCSAHKFSDLNGNKEIFAFWKTSSNSMSATLTPVFDLSSGEVSRISSVGTIKKDVTLHVGAGNDVKFYNIYGNEIEISETVPYTLTDEPIYAVITKTKEPCFETFMSDDTVKINGQNIEPNKALTLVVYKQNEIGNPMYYIDQKMSDNTGKVEFEFKRDKYDVYEFYIRNGANLIEELTGNSDYKIKMRYYINDMILDDISKLKDNDIVKAEVILTNLGGNDEKLMLLGAAYGDVLICSDTMEASWNGNEEMRLETSLKIEESKKVNTLRFMLWNDKYSPVIKAISAE